MPTMPRHPRHRPEDRRQDHHPLQPVGQQVFSAQTANSVKDMLELAVQPGGTAPRAQVLGYRVAGKTGTAAKLVNGRYSKSDYNGSFVGFVPSRRPALTVLVVIPLSSALVEDKKAQAAQFHKQSIPEALREAFTHRGYVLLCLGYTVCGFQLMFISVHFPAYLLDQRMTPQTGMTALALIGLFNIFGSYAWGWLGGRYTKKYLLFGIYVGRTIAAATFILLPITPLSVLVFSAVMVPVVAVAWITCGAAELTRAATGVATGSAPAPLGTILAMCSRGMTRMV